MKKGKLKSSIIFLVILISISLVLAQSTSLIKSSKKDYRIGDKVFASSTISASDKLCRSVEEEFVKLFVVNNKENWDDGDTFEDAREDGPTDVPNTRFSSILIWDDAEIGEYDLIIDCDNNKQFDADDPINNEEFVVTSRVGAGKVIDEDTIVRDSSWGYDPEQPEGEIEIFQFRISSEIENIELDNITFEFVNRESLNFDGIEVYVDENNNGELDPEEDKIGEFLPENVLFNGQRASIPLNFLLLKDTPKGILVVYKLNQNTSEGEYRIRVSSLFGTGESSKKELKFYGFPITSNKLTVVEKRTCLGSLRLNINPNPVPVGSEITAQISNLTGCVNKRVSIRSTACNLPRREVSNCILDSNNRCETTFNIQRDQTYHACIDKNEDKDYVDFGEGSTVEVNILAESTGEVIEEVQSEDNMKDSSDEETSEGETTIQDTTEIVQEVLGGGDSSLVTIQASNSLLVLLEITLLLILFVLVMILFKLRGPVPLDEIERIQKMENEGSKLEDDFVKDTKENNEEEKKDD